MRILIVDDQKSVRLTTAQAVRADGHEADHVDNGPVALLKLQEEVYDLVLLDLFLGGHDGLEFLDRIGKAHRDLPVVVITAHASIETAVEAMRRGALDYLEKPFTPDHLRQVVTRVTRLQRMRARVQNLEQQVAQQGPPIDFASGDPAMAAAVDVVERAANSEVSVLLLGESGTGKSVLARYVHEHSPRATEPFITVSCPSLSKELLESELFGHVKGSFTGAVRDTWGKVDAARGGTLFLDEIGELPLELQPKLLRLLQERQFERIGETKTRTADVRVVAATNRDLAALVRDGLFREDLFYRLNVITLTMPPLRDRPADLERLATEFLTFFARQAGRAVRDFSPTAWRCLRAHQWPGNIRELRNAIERAVILARGEFIESSDLPEALRAVDAPGVMLGGLVSLDAIERAHAERVIARTSTLEEAARVLGIDSATLYRKRKRWEAADQAVTAPAPAVVS
jgi:two-component system, NtrC family, response regulator AlgB